jgi:hyperosmotically inducible periplasmic protein
LRFDRPLADSTRKSFLKSKEKALINVSGKSFRTILCGSLLLGIAGLPRVLANAQSTPAPDNTKMNQQQQTTADQQKQNPSDRAITQQIRQSIMKDKSLSTYAHNIKIITQNGQVTLKGPVRSESEKAAIEAKATAVAGTDKVTNDLNVKP